MEENKELLMQQHCDKLVEGGHELTITWEGGGDNGWFTMLLDSKEMEAMEEIDREIVYFVENQMGYGSFAGDFYTDGKLVYDPVIKAFIGTDNYSETESVVAKCRIELVVPEEIWFDRIDVLIDDGHSGHHASVGLTLTVKNGPLPPGMHEWISRKELELSEKFEDVILGLEDYAGVYSELAVDRRDFTACKKGMRFLFEEMDYSQNNEEEREVYIRFNATEEPCPEGELPGSKANELQTLDYLLKTLTNENT